jgi:PncC family amidohydrolase
MWAQQALDGIVLDIERRWHPYVFGREGATLSQAVGDLLRQRAAMLATAESCTGGWLGKAIVDRPGSSDYYAGGWVTYSNQMKVSCLGVPAELIEKHGAVSAEVAQVMALGAARKAAQIRSSTAPGGWFALSITGIAGPDGGTPTKPVGTVWIGLSKAGVNARDNELVHARRFEFPGDRHVVRNRAVKAALQMLRFALMEVDSNTPLLWDVRP